MSKPKKQEPQKQSNWFKRHRVLTAVGGVILLLLIIGVGNSENNNSSTPKPSPVASGVTTAKAVGLNQPARDGKFEFVVKTVTCGQTSVGANEYATKDAQGQYCLMSLTVKNIGDRAQGLYSSNQKLLNSRNQQFAADDIASSYLDTSYSTLFSNINPGNQIEGTIVFDFPKGEIPVQAELHDDAFSGGVKVNLAN